MSSDLCESACREMGWLGEAIVFVLVAARAGWSEHKRRVAQQESERARREADRAQQEVHVLRVERASMQQASSRPPPARVPVEPVEVDASEPPWLREREK